MESGKSVQVSLDNQPLSIFGKAQIHDNKQKLPLRVVPVNARKALATDLAQIQLKPKGTLFPLQKLVSPPFFPYVAHKTVAVEHDAMVLRDSDVDGRFQVPKYTSCDHLVALALLLVCAGERHDVHVVVIHILQLLLAVCLNEREQEVSLGLHSTGKEDMS